MPEVIIVGREGWMSKAVESCARGEISFASLCEAFAGAGYKTTGLFEMVRSADRTLTTKKQS